MDSLSSNLRSFGERYPVARTEPFKGNPVSEFLRKDIVSKIGDLGLFPTDGYKILGSVGKGGWAEIPWLAVFDNDETTTLHHGQFIIMVFSADYSRIFFSLNHGSVTFFDRHNRRETNEYLQRVALILGEGIEAPGFVKGRINLGASSSVGRFLELGNIVSREYVLSDLDDYEIIRTLEELKVIYSKAVSLEKSGLVTLAYPDNADVI